MRNTPTFFAVIHDLPIPTDMDAHSYPKPSGQAPRGVPYFILIELKNKPKTLNLRTTPSEREFWFHLIEFSSICLFTSLSSSWSPLLRLSLRSSLLSAPSDGLHTSLAQPHHIQSTHPEGAPPITYNAPEPHQAVSISQPQKLAWLNPYTYRSPHLWFWPPPRSTIVAMSSDVNAPSHPQVPTNATVEGHSDFCFVF